MAPSHLRINHIQMYFQGCKKKKKKVATVCTSQILELSSTLLAFLQEQTWK